MADDDFIIETRNLRKVFPNGLAAVTDLSIKVRRGEVFSLLGPNGAGKTTCIRMMVGLLRPTSGETLIDGEVVRARSRVVKEKIGVCPQNITLWDNLTVRENMRLMGDMYKVPKHPLEERIASLLRELRLSGKRDELASTLSGGMQRRLNLAMALVHDPEIAVLDEPSPGLDPQTRLVLWEFIKSIARDVKKTVILTTHYMMEADRLSDTVAIIDNGKLLVCDTPDNLKNSIGEGDMMEITLGPGADEKNVASTFEGFDWVLEVRLMESTIWLRAHNAVKRMPWVFRRLESAGVEVLDVKLRKNSLEDVFISLTGRGLRE